jgi:polysaccharide pyruvyl transferase WcaK-like protein
MASNISSIGEWLFAKLLNSKLVKNVYFRDDISIQNYYKYRFISKEIQEVWDPGILISRKYPKIFDGKKKYIGIGVSSPMNLKYSGDSFVEINYDSVLLKIISHLISLKKNILLFTNGTIEDEEYKERLYAKISNDEKEKICLASRPNRPLDLVNIITQTEYIISQRLHSNIIAYSYKIPSIGIVWDKKLVGFFKKIKRERMLLDLNNQDWFSVFTKLLADSLMQIHIDDHTQFLNEADFQIKEMMIQNKRNDD